MSTQSQTNSKPTWVIGVTIAVLLFWSLTSFFSAIQLLKSLETMEVAAVARYSRYLHLNSSIASLLTFRSSPNIESIDALLGIATKAETATQIIAQIQSTADTQSIDLSDLFKLIESVQKDATRLEKNLSDCSICSTFLPYDAQSHLFTALPYIQTVGTVSSHFQTGTHRYLVVFQNSDELRATGGFMGSYAIITLTDGVMQPMIIEDIYDADGQFTGKIPAPSGVHEYLSSDNGLRLPDANWYPHFPTSAKQMLQFFALGERDDFEGVIAITDSYFEELLGLLGPIWLPDYQLTVTPDNLTTVLRSDREDFFAGSIQKEHLLSQFKNQVLIALSSGGISPQEFAQVTLKHMRQKNILAYSSDETLQTFFEAFSVDGSLFTHTADTSLAFVESNVGINKANQHISRALSLYSTETTLTARYLIKNENKPPLTTQLTDLVESQQQVKTAKNQANHLGYVNYLRIIYPSSWNLSKLEIPGTENVVTDTTNQVGLPGKDLTQTGFLVVVPEQQEVLVTITFQTTQPISGTTIELYKQPGTIPMPVWLETTRTTPFTAKPTLILEKNSVTIMP